MPELTGVLETALHVDDLERSVRFYQDLFGFPVLFRDDRLCALNVAGRQVLLLFKKGGSSGLLQTPGGIIPPHDGAGRLHFAFAIPREELSRWEEHLGQHGVVVESKVTWERGGQSLFFRDPDGHLAELATPGTWAIY